VIAAAQARSTAAGKNTGHRESTSSGAKRRTDMTQTTDERQEQAAAERVAIKLQEFHNGLPAEEQAALLVILEQGAVAASSNEDVAGYVVRDPNGEPTVRDWCLTWQFPMGRIVFPVPNQRGRN
jgi:hypothetical protein